MLLYYFLVACGSLHTLVLLHNGEVYSCGNNDYGQLGHEKSRTKLRKYYIITENTMMLVIQRNN